MASLVSVVLPTFNAAPTLVRAIESCLGQTYSNMELVVVNDGSTDGSEVVIERSARTDNRLKSLRLDTRCGVAAAAEAGRLAASGEFIARMDADDQSHPDRIAAQVAFLRSHPELAGCGVGVRLMDGLTVDSGRGLAEHVRWLNTLVEPETLAAQRFIDSPIANPGSMVRSDVLETVGGHHDPEWAEDYDLWLRILNAGMRLTNMNRILLDWHDSPGRLTRTDSRYSALQFSRAKAWYLARLPMVMEHGIEIAGAGPTGKRIARELIRIGVKVHAFYEVNPRRCGERIAGIPVRDHKDFRHDDPVLLGAVGRPGARDRVRAIAESAGYREGVDFFCVA